MKAPVQHAGRAAGPGLRGALCALLLACTAGPSLAQSSACGDLANAYGPFDYRTQRAALKVVEEYHFTLGVEALAGGKSGRIGGDIDYTLRASPNHHRALLALSRLGQRMKVSQVPDTRWTVDCYFDRALRFQPDDNTARMLFVQHLAATGRKPQALEALAEVVRRAGDNGFTHYNAGLLYLDLGEPQRALAQAHRAESLGFTRPDLKNALASAGQWRDAAASAPASAPPPAATTEAVAAPRPASAAGQ
jgi:hypothetical protein